MGKILIMDDDPLIRQFCYDILKAEGHEVSTEARGDSALARIVKEKPDLVLMDLEVPGESGLSFLKRLPNDPEHRLRVIVFSGNIDEAIEADARRLGAIDVIHKPIEINELRKRIRAGLGAMANKSQDKKVLIVDDEESIRKLLEAYFRRKGYSSRLAASGEEALEMIREETPSIIFLDVSMPGMDGILTLKKIREINSTISVVMSTGIQDEDIAREATELGACAYLLKPFDMKYLDMITMTYILLAD